MLPLTKALWAAHVWMTAFTILFASISPCQCVCPDGHRKLFCLGITCGTNGCCCCGACGDSARSHGDGPTVQHTSVKATNRRCCCCQGTSARNYSQTAERNHLRSRGCRLQLSQAVIFTELRKAISINDFSAELLLLDTPSLVLPIPMTCPFLQFYETYRPPPPPDLVVTFQHFVI
jgi:hypothetical protein